MCASERKGGGGGLVMKKCQLTCVPGVGGDETVGVAPIEFYDSNVACQFEACAT